MRATLQAQSAAIAQGASSGGGGYPRRAHAAPRRTTATTTANAASLLLLENYKLRYPMVDQRATPSRIAEHMPPPSEEDLLLNALNSAAAPQQQQQQPAARTRDFLTSLLLNQYETSTPTFSPSPGPNTLISALARFGASQLVEQQLHTASPTPLFNDADPLADDTLQLRLSHAATRARLQPQQLTNARGNISRAAIGSQAHGPPGANVFVFHIPNEWDESDLAVVFAQYGTILSARIATDKTSGRRLGFGFISFTKISDACGAVQALNGFSVAGKRLKVTVKRGEQHVAAQYAPHLTFSSETTPRLPPAPDPPVVVPTTPPTSPSADRGRTPPPAEPWIDDGGGGGERNRSRSTGQPHSLSGKESTTNPATTDRVPTDTSTGGHTDCTVSSQCARCSDGTGGAASRRRRRRRKAREAAMEDEANESLEDGVMDIESVFAQVLKRFTDEEDAAAVSSSQPVVDDENWLELLTALLRAPQGRRFMFTLLKAAGLVYGSSAE